MRPLLFVFALMFAAPCLRGEEKSAVAEPAPLQLKWQPGFRYVQRIEINQTGKLPSKEGVKNQHANITAEMVLSVRHHSKDDWRSLGVSWNAFSIDGANGDAKFGYNSARPNKVVDEGTAKSMGADAEGVFITASYLTTLDTPKAKEFMAAMQKKFGANLKTPNDLSVPQYDAIYLYKAAVEKAGSTDAEKVIAALSTVSFDGPRGVIQMNKQRHAPLSMYLGQVQADGSVKVSETFKNVDPGEQCPKM